jgi:hypothetical protein
MPTAPAAIPAATAPAAGPGDAVVIAARRRRDGLGLGSDVRQGGAPAPGELDSTASAAAREVDPSAAGKVDSASAAASAAATSAWEVGQVVGGVVEEAGTGAHRSHRGDRRHDDRRRC